MFTEANVNKEGDVLDYTPTSAVVGGQVLQIGALAAIAQRDIAANVLGSVVIDGLAEFRAAAVVGEAGDPVGWDEDGTGVDGNTGALTVDPATWDFVVGSLAKDLAAADGRAFVRLNRFSPTKPYWPGKVYETKTDNYTVDAEDAGKVLCIATDAKAFTLPAYAAGFVGFEITFVNTGASGNNILTISPNSSDKIMGPDIAGTDDKDYINTKATAKRWDYVTLRADGANGWWIVARRGTWAVQS